MATTTRSETGLGDLNERSREVFRRLVETYLETGEPVGSRTISRTLDPVVSPATVRNVMQDLEDFGLLDSPHVSSGRVPTERGLRLFVDGLLEMGEIRPEERAEIERAFEGTGDEVAAVLDRAGALLSGLTRSASLVLAPKLDTAIKHLEFVSLSPDRVLVVLVTADGQVENRIFRPPAGLTPSAMREAANFLNAVLEGRTIPELRGVIEAEIRARRQEIDSLTQKLIEQGLAAWTTDPHGDQDRLIVRGSANLLGETVQPAELAVIRSLFDDLERKRDLAQLLELAEQGDGVKVFIGSENKLFSLSGSSLVVSPYMTSERRIVGAVGVIGPTRVNYARIVPIVDYTAQLVGRLIGGPGKG